MIKAKKSFSILSALVLIFSVFCATGCTNTKMKQENKPKQDMNMNKGINTVEPESLNNRATKISNELAKINGIEKARVVISEKRALVGITIPNKAEGKITDELKKQVEKTVKSTDKEIETVAVSADAGLVERITKVADGLKAGKGINEFGVEIKELFNRIVPTTK